MLTGLASGCWLSALGAGMQYNREKKQMFTLQKEQQEQKEQNKQKEQNEQKEDKYRVRQRGCSLTHSAGTPPAKDRHNFVGRGFF